MKKAKPKNLVIPRGGIPTRFKGPTELEKLNKEALKRIRAFKGAFG